MKRSTRPAPLATVVPYVGPVHWRHLVEWLRDDGVITPAEAERTIARCSQAESAPPATHR